MSVIDYAHKPHSHSFLPPVGGLTVEILRGIRALARRVAVARRERRTVTSLSGLSDAALKDIGVARSGIRHIARSVAEESALDYRVIHRG